jgi:hypothetical protein
MTQHIQIQEKIETQISLKKNHPRQIIATPSVYESAWFSALSCPIQYS